MRAWLMGLWLVIAGAACADAVIPSGPAPIAVLCYHEVVDTGEAPFAPDAMTITVRELAGHFSWLQEHGYTAVSLDQVLAAGAGKARLPDKPVLLTFDDGYVSFHSRVLPLLKLFNYPAVLALVGSWMEEAPAGSVAYGASPVARGKFLTWEQVRELQDSGLVEIASHSHDLHKGIAGNPQGNLQPAATTRNYDAASGGYEDEARYQARVLGDLRKSAELIEQRTGRRPRALVWPYGSFSPMTLGLARDAGYAVTFTLDVGLASAQRVPAMSRLLIKSGANLGDLLWMLAHPQPFTNVRAARLSLDEVYAADPALQEQNLGRLLDRVAALKLNTVYLGAFADADGDGSAEALYFPNRHLPVRADLFNRVAWQLRTRAGVKVHAWMPTLAFELPQGHVAAAYVEGSDGQAAGAKRLSPFSADARQIVAELFEDLGKSADFAGILFGEDATLGADEDLSAPALDYYRSEWHLDLASEAARSDASVRAQWTRKKRDALIWWTQLMAEHARFYRASLSTVRSITADRLAGGGAGHGEESIKALLGAYDHVLVHWSLADYPSGVPRKLLRQVDAVGALPRMIFQVAPPHDGSSPGTGSVSERLAELTRAGAYHLSYDASVGPGSAALDDVLAASLSGRTHPYR